MRAIKGILIGTLSMFITINSPGQDGIKICGWNILSDSLNDDIETINAASSYNINHLQLSHDLVMDLMDIREPARQKLVNELISRAHEAGIKEVVAWDHALYSLDYYPDKFKTGAEKLAAVVDAVADVLCEEMGKKLYIRTFAYTDAEYINTIGCIEHIKNQDVILMMKETPHDFFLTQPNDRYAGTINRQTLMEFDCGNEFNGQGVIADTWPEYIIKRWSDLIKRPNVIGYVARTDRYRNTRIVGTPNEILLYTLKRYTEDQNVTADVIYDEFISAKYGVKKAEEALKLVKKAEKVMDPVKYKQVYELFHRTLITARIYESVSTAYFGYRIYSRGEEFRSRWLIKTMEKALDRMLADAAEIDNYKEMVPRGQWNWRADAAIAREYHEKITKTGWKEYGNVVFR